MKNLRKWKFVTLPWANDGLMVCPTCGVEVLFGRHGKEDWIDPAEAAVAHGCPVEEYLIPTAEVRRQYQVALKGYREIIRDIPQGYSPTGQLGDRVSLSFALVRQYETTYWLE